MIYTHRVPPDVAERIGLLRDEVAGLGRTVANERLHMTLGITNDYADHSPELVRLLIKIGRSIDAEPFRLVIDRLSGNGSTITLRPSRCPSGLADLQRQVQRRLAYGGIDRAGWSFNPHVTLAYRQAQPFLRLVPPFEWDATELVLIHSLVGETQHVELGRWPLVRRQLDLLGG